MSTTTANVGHNRAGAEGVRTAVILAASLWLLTLPAGAPAGEPPNQNDPAPQGPQHGDHRHRLLRHIPLRPALVRRLPRPRPEREPHLLHRPPLLVPRGRYRFREVSSARLVIRDGETVSLESKRRLAYAIWEYGRSENPNQQAAVMLYVHSLMGDARPGEASPSELNAAVRAPSRGSHATRRATTGHTDWTSA